MLFSAKLHPFTDLGLELAYLPVEANLTECLSLLDRVTFEFHYKVELTAEHLTNSGTRSACASQLVCFYVTRREITESAYAHKKLADFIRLHPTEVAPGDVQARKTMLAAVQVEVLGDHHHMHPDFRSSRDRPAIGFRVSATREYSVKGVRSEEAIQQRAADAAALAQHELLERREQLARAHICSAQLQLLQLLDAYNAEQVTQLLTQVDLGLLPVAPDSEKVEAAKKRYAGAMLAFEEAEQQKNIAWAAFSTAYKEHQLRALKKHTTGQGDLALLQRVLLDRINPDTPIRYL